MTSFNHAITQPPHAPRVFNPIIKSEAEFTIDVRADFIGVEQCGVEHRRESASQRRFASAGKPHNQNLAVCQRLGLTLNVHPKTDPMLVSIVLDAVE